MKDKIDDVLGHKPWEIEIEYYVKRGADRDAARWFTIGRYMEFNDLRPLRAALAKAKPIDDKTAALDSAILQSLIDLIDQDRLVVKPLRARAGKPGAPKIPAKFARDLVGALCYLKLPKKSRSAAAREEIARKLRTTPDALREAVTSLNNLRRKEASADKSPHLTRAD
jgi:hypothetical protein